MSTSAGPPLNYACKMPNRASDMLSSSAGSLHVRHPGEVGTAW